MLPESQQINELIYFLFCGDIRFILQAVCNILVHIQVGKQCIILKYNVKSPFLHRYIRDILSVEDNLSAVCRCKSQHQVQKSGLSTA